VVKGSDPVKKTSLKIAQDSILSPPPTRPLTSGQLGSESSRLGLSGPKKATFKTGSNVGFEVDIGKKPLTYRRLAWQLAVTTSRLTQAHEIIKDLRRKLKQAFTRGKTSNIKRLEHKIGQELLARIRRKYS